VNTQSARARIAQLFDFLALLVFVLIGRDSHGEHLTVLGILATLWPFLVGLVVGHLVSLAHRHPFRIVPTGIIIWISTVVIGMLLRLASHQGVKLSFVIVATLFIALFLLGWRVIATLATRRRGRR
jgi:hypothetical protein